MDEMLKLVTWATFMVICAEANYTVKCYNGSEPSTSFEPAADGVKGRYTLEWCTEADKSVTEWEIQIRFTEPKKPEQCKESKLWAGKTKGKEHSFTKLNVSNHNCTTSACFSTSLDLIFEACYTIKNMLHRRTYSSESVVYIQYISNNFTDKETLSEITPAVKPVPYEDHMSFTWFLYPVPAVLFEMEICKQTAPSEIPTCQNVTQNCTADLYQINCNLAPERGKYDIYLTRHEPWTYGRIAKISTSSEFSFDGPAGPEAAPKAGGYEWAWALGAVALGALALALALTCRAQGAQAFRAQVLKAWRHTEESEVRKASDGEEEGLRILLLYARDCGQLLEVVRQLKTLLQTVAPGRVYDLYAAGVAAAAAAAPGAWLRALMARQDLKVLLLQTPAAACLYGTQLRAQGDTLQVQSPLLGAQVVFRTPHASDALLQMALRMLTDTAAAHAHAHPAQPYRKYFVAQIPGLEAELVPLVTPLRRYALPQGAIPLLQDLAPGVFPADPTPDLEHLLLPLQQAVEALLDYVSEHPDYLNEELFFLPS